MAEEWRRVVATLADATRRQVYAAIVLELGVDVPNKKREKAIAALEAAGLVTMTDGKPVAIGEVFTELLSAEPAVTRTGVDRFIRNGRIEQYPVKAGDRLEVLTWARDQVLSAGERVSEKQLGERLAALTGDVATLRRYLVDAGLLQRDADGAEYWR